MSLAADSTVGCEKPLANHGALPARRGARARACVRSMELARARTLMRPGEYDGKEKGGGEEPRGFGKWSEPRKVPRDGKVPSEVGGLPGRPVLPSGGFLRVDPLLALRRHVSRVSRTGYYSTSRDVLTVTYLTDRVGPMFP